ncbi:unnamed protein product [Heligmosomoides polygyrus]|uniref:MAM domain-containing protein n=1 Tax=Heligmosomoides polygyrus TaxID=6339 RepID=A0A183FMU4_HELPZ|nr:unnamed protein product [Heligmosomoides polygyrus]
MKALLALMITLLPILSTTATRCYDYTSTSGNRQPVKSWVDCPFDAKFCFKRYEEQRGLSSQLSWLSQRSCGTSNLCLVTLHNHTGSSILQLMVTKLELYSVDPWDHEKQI